MCNVCLVSTYGSRSAEHRFVDSSGGNWIRYDLPRSTFRHRKALLPLLSIPISMPPPRSRSPKRRFRGARSAPRSGRHRSPLTRCRPCSEVKALRALLDRHDKLAAEKRCLLDELQLLKDEHAGATKSAVESLKNDLAAKDADIASLKKDLAEARTTIDGCPRNCPTPSLRVH